MAEVSEAIKVSKEEWAIIESLIYFGVFDYPLKPSEISRFVPIQLSPLHVVPCLNYLENHGLIEQHEGYFGIRSNEELVKRRIEGNLAAEKMRRKARKYASLIAGFPYVRGVYISGSLSKGYLSEDGDIDYFIITKAKRLWIARTLLILFKKIFLLNNRKYFCVNYFIDTDNLEVPDKNIFTATEIKTLIPMYNHDLYQKFIEANGWSGEVLPMMKPAEFEGVNTGVFGVFKPLVEAILNLKIGNAIDRFFMNRTLKRWESHFDHFTASEFEQAMRTRTYVSKHHPQNFQAQVLDKMQNIREEFKAQHNIVIAS